MRVRRAVPRCLGTALSLQGTWWPDKVARGRGAPQATPGEAHVGVRASHVGVRTKRWMGDGSGETVR